MYLKRFGKRKEVEFTLIPFKGKLAGKSWKYQQQVEGLIRTRFIMLIMAIISFKDILYDYIVFDVFSIDMLQESILFSICFLTGFFLFNKKRVIAIIVALIPSILLAYTYLFSSSFDLEEGTFQSAVVILIALGFWYDYKAKNLRKILEPMVLENHLIIKD